LAADIEYLVNYLAMAQPGFLDQWANSHCD